MNMLNNMKPSKHQIMKAERRGMREAQLENQTGWATSYKPHKNKKKYSRKDYKRYEENNTE
jgi:hypothetical protein